MFYLTILLGIFVIYLLFWRNHSDKQQPTDESTSQGDNSLGIENCSIPSSRITASSSTDDGPAFSARLNGNKSWYAGSPADSFLEVDLDTVHFVSAVATQGNPIGNHDYVKNYKVQYSTNGVDWDFYQENYKLVLEGNTNYSTPVKRTLEPNIKARYVRFWPTAWFQWPCLRVELYGRPAPPEKMTENGVVTIQVDAQEKQLLIENGVIEEESDDENEFAEPEINMDYLHNVSDVTLDDGNDVDTTEDHVDFTPALETSTPAKAPRPNYDVNKIERVNSDDVLTLNHNGVDLKRLMDVKTKLELEARKQQDGVQVTARKKKKVTLDTEPSEYYFYLPRQIHDDMWGDSPTGSFSEGLELNEKPLIEVQDGGAPLAKREDDAIEDDTNQQTHSVTIRSVTTITTRVERYVEQDHDHVHDKHEHGVHDRVHDKHDVHDKHVHDEHDHVHDKHNGNDHVHDKHEHDVHVHVHDKHELEDEDDERVHGQDEHERIHDKLDEHGEHDGVHDKHEHDEQKHTHDEREYQHLHEKARNHEHEEREKSLEEGENADSCEDTTVVCTTNVSHDAPGDVFLMLNGFYDPTPYTSKASCEHLHPTDPAVQVAMESSFSERVDSMDQINIDSLASRRFSGLDLLQSPYDAVSGEDIQRLLAWEDDTLPGWTRIKKSRDCEIFKGTAVDGGPPIIKAVITLKKIAYEEAVKRITDWETRKQWDKTFDKITFIEQTYNFNIIHCAMKKQGLTLAVLDDVDIDEPYHASVWSVADHPDSCSLSPGKPLRYETMVSGLVIRPTQDGYPSTRVTLLCQVKGSVSQPLKGTYLTGNPDKWIEMLRKYSSKSK